VYKNKLFKWTLQNVGLLILYVIGNRLNIPIAENMALILYVALFVISIFMLMMDDKIWEELLRKGNILLGDTCKADRLGPLPTSVEILYDVFVAALLISDGHRIVGTLYALHILLYISLLAKLRPIREKFCKNSSEEK